MHKELNIAVLHLVAKLKMQAFCKLRGPNCGIQQHHQGQGWAIKGKAELSCQRAGWQHWVQQMRHVVKPGAPAGCRQ